MSTGKHQFMKLNEYEAFNAMVFSLDMYCQRTHSEDMGALSRDMMFLTDGSTADPAVWEDWLYAIEYGKGKTHQLQLGKKDSQEAKGVK